ncbi:MAG: MFS transporter [Bacteroidales bacterium]|nr:MFS transporter [Bacteroidales bacterium]
MKNNNITLRLIVMNFIEFAIWGAYLTSMGSFLADAGLGPKIWLFFATQGFVSIFMPALMGIVADKWIPAQKVLSLCQLLAGVFMIGAGVYAMSNGTFIQHPHTSGIDGALHTVYASSPSFNFTVFYLLYLLSVAFFMPTIAISNSVAYNALEGAGKDSVKAFPPIRVFGTIGFICSMYLVNFLSNSHGVQFQHSYEQFFVSGAFSLVLCAYALTMPNCPCKPSTEGAGIAESLGLNAFKLFKQKQFAIFFIFSMLLGASLQITNGYANTFITSFKENPLFASSWGASNANAIISLGQISETLCILLIPFCMKKFGIKNVMLIAMFAWVFRFGFFGLGNPGSGVWLFILSGIVYGVAFDFFNISGSLYVNENTDNSIRSSAQGLFMLMTNGLGASIGTWAAGRVVNALVYNPQAKAIAAGLDPVQVSAAGHWDTAWYVFAGYALVVGVLFAILFKNPEKEKAAA